MPMLAAALRSRLTLAWLGLALMLPPLAWWVFGPTGFAVEIVQRRWHADIEVERLRLEAGTDWCDELPAEAFDVTRRVIADPHGRRAGPAEHCRYRLLAWRRQWIAREDGDAASAVRWPSPPLRVEPHGQPGSERLGRRELHYELQLRNGSGQVWTCRTTPDTWQRLQTGQRLRMPVDRWGTADCGLLG